MSALLEWQRAVRVQLLQAAAPTDERLAVYRSTCITTLTNALRLNFPAVRLLVGGEFFEAAATRFIAALPPRSAYLNDYGADFAGFLAQFPPAAAIAYLADVARLEWAVSRALHAPDSTALDPSRLTELDAVQVSAVRFKARPGVSLLRLDLPADDIWRAVLAQDDGAMAAVDLHGGPVCLLIERSEAGLRVQRMATAAGRFSEALLAGGALGAALGLVSADSDSTAQLAGHLRSGLFTDFTLTGESA